MRILILNHNLKEHGNYFRALKFAREMAAAGHELTLVTSSDRWYRSRRYRIGAVRVVESPSYSLFVGRDEGWSPLGILFRAALVLSRRYDVVYGFSHKPVDCLPAFLSRLFHGSFYITDWCDWYGKGGMLSHRDALRRRDPALSGLRRFILRLFDRGESFLEEFVPRHAHLVTVICRSLFERARSIGVKNKRLIHLVSGADTENIRPEEKSAARKEWRIKADQDVTYLGYVANYHPDERMLLEALAELKRRGTPLRLIVAGPDFYLDDDAIKALNLRIQKIKQPGDSPRPGQYDIMHFGRRPFSEIPSFLAAADILLLPMSDIVFNRGRWPNKFGDYLAAGRPVVANAVGDIPPMMIKWNCGILAEANPQSFAKALKQAAESRNSWEMWGKHARQAAKTDLDWTATGGRLMERMKELMSKKKKRKA